MPQQYRLGFGAALASLGYVALLWLLLVALCVHDLRREREDDDPTLFVRLMSHVGAQFTVLGCLAYIRIGCRAPRPESLHRHGLVLLMLLMETFFALLVVSTKAGAFGRKDAVVFWPLATMGYAIWGIRRSLFVWLMMQKMAALAPPPHCCLSTRFWGITTVTCTLVISWGYAIPGFAYNYYMVLRGTSYEDALDSRGGIITGAGDVTDVDRVVMGFLFVVGSPCIIGVFVGTTGFMIASWYAVRSTVRKLIKRDVSGEMLAKSRALVWRQYAGVLVSLATSNLVILANVVRETAFAPRDLLGHAYRTLQVVDGVGDAAGILLLSGIGVLLLREDPEAGDISASIRSTLHAAVLTSRADSVFEGVVRETPMNCCVVSFPGKFLPEWNALTWLCEQGALSSACVFLPKADPKQRFGKHVPCPDTPDSCWCSQIYGERKPWGCAWFEAWRLNVEKAAELKLELIVVFFPRQRGQGVVAWRDLRSVDLWDGVGLGGSQKAEVAFLHSRGYPLVYEDLEETKRRISRRRLR